ncbi:MAG TPA: hypothetical protein VER79_04405 [Candidatus Limnocylindrales bacterium]|nr:hypothetical protein [Candidatus Limnocylindrales bacterium]
MPAPLVEQNDELDVCLHRALWAEPYPSAVQRMQARRMLMTRAGRQSMLPPTEARTSLFSQARHVAALLRADGARMLHHLLIDEDAYRRAKHGDFGRAVHLLHSPYIRFQTMW